jgi:hypothetical protein
MAVRLVRSFVVAALLAGCKAEPSTVLMMRTDISVCDKAKGAPVIELPADGSYVLNHKPRSRGQLENWIRTGLGPLQSSNRFVIVRFDSTRGRELAWIIPSVNKIGGEVISPAPCPFELASPAT